MLIYRNDYLSVKDSYINKKYTEETPIYFMVILCKKKKNPEN